MKPHLIFKQISPEFADTLLQYLRDEQREAYKAAVATLAAKRNLRPVFVQRKPLKDQFAWLTKTLQLPLGADIAEQVIQIWLMKGRSEMLVQFLDDVGIPHDGEGAVDDFPDTLDADKAKRAVGNLFDKFPAEESTLYLLVFLGQNPDGWPGLHEAVEAESRMCFTLADVS